MLKLTLPLLVGGFLCWYAYQQFTEEQFAEIKKTFLSADYFYIILSVFLGFLADMSRAVRWEFLLRPMGYRTSLLHRAMAVFRGYVVNVTIPRSGEVSRALLVSNYDLLKSPLVPLSQSGLSTCYCSQHLPELHLCYSSM